MFFDLFLEILAVKDIPLPAPGGYGAGEGMDFFAHDLIQAIFTVEELFKNALGLSQGMGLIGEVCQVLSP